MTKAIHIEHYGMQYGVELHHNQIVFYRIEYDDSGLAAWGTDDDIIHNYQITNDVWNAVALFRKIADAVRTIIFTNKLNYYTFHVSDGKRAALYKRFAEEINGYRAVHEGKYFFLYKQ